MLKMLLAVRRKSSARNSLMAIVLFTDILSDTWPGPSRMLRPALPKDEPTGFTQPGAVPPPGVVPLAVCGTQNAATLNHWSVERLLMLKGWPGTTLARNEPLTPRLTSTVPPKTRTV